MFKLDIKLDPEVLEKIKKMQADATTRYARYRRTVYGVDPAAANGDMNAEVLLGDENGNIRVISSRTWEPPYVKPTVIDATAQRVDESEAS